MVTHVDFTNRRMLVGVSMVVDKRPFVLEEDGTKAFALADTPTENVTTHIRKADFIILRLRFNLPTLFWMLLTVISTKYEWL
jgi:hypothetical protein